MKLTPKQKAILQKMLRMNIVVELMGNDTFRYSLDDGFVSDGMIKKMRASGLIISFHKYPYLYYIITDLGRKALEEQP